MMTIVCSCCHRVTISGLTRTEEAIVSDPSDALSAVPLRGLHRVLVNELVKAYPSYVNTAALIDALYGHDADGGPERADVALVKVIGHVRPKLVGFGWTIPAAKRGPGSAGYRLAPMEIKK